MANKKTRRRRREQQESQPEPLVERTIAEAIRSPGSLAQSIDEDGDEQDWLLAGGTDAPVVKENERKDSLAHARDLAIRQPHVKNALRLYRSYVLGREFDINLKPIDLSDKLTDTQKKVMRESDRAWSEFLLANKKHWGIRAFGHRVWRDGEQFTRKFTAASSEWPPKVRFLGAEQIDDPEGDTEGIRTVNGDVETPVSYLRVENNEHAENIPAEDIFHTKIDVDSNEKRGLTRFLPVIRFARQLNATLASEIIHRRLQSSIVMQRTFKGASPAAVTAQLDTLKTSTTSYREGETRREKVRPGSIINTGEGVEIDFKHPDSNFSDASPLLRWIVLHISSATGFAYYMISTDSSDSNFASALVQESPVVTMIEEEQDFFKWEIFDIWKWVMEEAVKAGRLSIKESSLFDDYEASFQFPSIISRDSLKDAQAHNLRLTNRTMSKRQAMRENNLDPDQQEREIEQQVKEAEKLGIADMGLMQVGGDELDSGGATGQNKGQDGSQVSGNKDDQGSRGDA